MRGLQVIDVDAAVLSSDDNAISRFRSMECAWDTDADSRWEETTQRCKKGKTRGTESTTAVRLWGRDDDGLSGCVIICDTWFPLYWQFSALAPLRERQALCDAIERNVGRSRCRASVKGYRNFYGWISDENEPSLPGSVMWLRVEITCVTHRSRLLQAVKPYCGKILTGTTGEHRADPATQILDRLSIVPGDWINISDSAIFFYSTENPLRRTTTNFSAQARTKDITLGSQRKQCPLRVLSFDIECYSASRCFPDASHDPIITIGCAVSELTGAHLNPVKRVALCLGSVATAPAHLVEKYIAYDTELQLLRAFAEEVRKTDPDVVIGYNTSGFDWAYIRQRAQTLGDDDIFHLSRVRDKVSVPEDRKFSAAATGDNLMAIPDMTGRFEIDLLWYAKKEFKLESYALNKVSREFLQEEKYDLPPKLIFERFEGDADGRAEIATYCIQDCALVERLADKWDAVTRICELAKVTRTRPQDVLWRGQQVRVYNQVLSRCHVEGYVLSDVDDVTSTRQRDEENAPEDALQGATVINPIPGYYCVPVMTLDFMSLYPTIMQTYNLCPSTLCTKGARVKTNTIPNTEFDFVQSSVKRGILPGIIDELLAARKAAKKEMKSESDIARKKLLDGKQLALKVSANSVYGVMGASFGLLHCRPVAASVTGAGRDILLRAVKMAEENGDCVIYGDTDSIMVKSPQLDSCAYDAAFARGEALAQRITNYFKTNLECSYIVLEMEKVYEPFVLVAKKRYVGLVRESPSDEPKMDAKGVELVRRDSCPLTRTAQKSIMDALLYSRDTEMACTRLCHALQEILPACLVEADHSILLQSRKLAGNYKTNCHAHVRVRDSITTRDGQGAAPKPGDRVEFLVVCSSSSKLADKAECASYVCKQKLPLDASYYLTQIEKPLIRLVAVPFAGTAFMTNITAVLNEERRKAQMFCRSNSMTQRTDCTWISGHRTKGGIQLTLASGNADPIRGSPYREETPRRRVKTQRSLCDFLTKE